MNENRLPEIDLPVDFLTGTDITGDILGLYRFPCRIQAGLFVLCLEGDMEATINLTDHHIKHNDLISIAPGTIIQFHSMTAGTKIYFIGFSSSFLERASLLRSNMDFSTELIENPILSLNEQDAELYKDFFTVLNKAYTMNRLQEKETTGSILLSMFSSLRTLYFEYAQDDHHLSRSEHIYKQLTKLVMKYFSTERRAAFYAEQLRITPQHLSVTVRQVSGKTVSDVIAEVVIMDAKAKLKSTNMTIQQISDSLNFPNVSFFGKYFRRYVGMTPNQYRKS